MGYVNAGITPHYNTSNERLGSRSESFRRMLQAEHTRQGTPTGFGIDNTAALIIENGIIRPFNQNNGGAYILSQDTDFTPRKLDPADEIEISSLN